MRSRLSLIAAAIALLVCVGLPVLDMFDTWDHAEETGCDSEYIFVVAALCVGAIYVVAQCFFHLTSPSVRAIKNRWTKLFSHLFIIPFGNFHCWAPDAHSPPLASVSSLTVLRI